MRECDNSKIWRSVEIMKLYILIFSLFFYYFLSLRRKYVPQYSILEYPQLP